jgi:hypothetical protein
VWQYGVTGKPGTAPGKLNTPDGFDLLLPDGSTPTHPVTGLEILRVRRSLSAARRVGAAWYSVSRCTSCFVHKQRFMLAS